MIIDFHTHCYIPEIAEKAVSRIPDPRLGPFFDGTLNGLKKYMKQNGIGMTVVQHIANKPASTQKVNDWALECAREEGVLSFGSVHPLFGECGDYKAEIARLKQSGIKGLKFHPYYQNFDIDDRIAYPVYEEAASQGMIMLFHIGLDVMMPGQFGTCDKFARVLDDLKYDKIVAAHLGGCMTFNDAAKLIWGRNIYLDTSLAFRFLNADLKRRLMETHDKTKLLFGTDGPWADPKIDYHIMDEFFSENDKKLIYHDNAAKLLGL